MISRKHRFHGTAGLSRVYRQGTQVRGPLFGVKALINQRRKGYRVAVVVSRKVNRSAVTRNRIRRRIYERVRLLESEIVSPHDIIISVYDDAAAMVKSQDLDTQLKKQLTTAGVLGRRVVSAQQN